MTRPTRAALSADRTKVRIFGNLWRSEINVEDLDRWISFYDRLAQKKDRLQNEMSIMRREKMAHMAKLLREMKGRLEQ